MELKSAQAFNEGVTTARYWMPDASCKACTACATPFTLFRRKHHCRFCGRIYCASCSTQKIDGRAFGLDDAVRVCDECKRLESLVAVGQVAVGRGRVPARVFLSSNDGSGQLDDGAALNHSTDADNIGSMGHNSVGASPLAGREAPPNVSGSRGLAESMTFSRGRDLSSGGGGGLAFFDDRTRLLAPGGSLFSAPATQDAEQALLSLALYGDAALRMAVKNDVDEFMGELDEAHRSEWAAQIVKLARRVAIAVDPNVKAGDRIDLGSYVKIKGLRGAQEKGGASRVGACDIVPGVVFRHRLPHKGMRSDIAAPRVLVIDDAIVFGSVNRDAGANGGGGDQNDAGSSTSDIPGISGSGETGGSAPGQNRLVSIETLLEQEVQWTQLIAAKILSLRPDVVFVSRAVTSLAMEALRKGGVSVVSSIHPNILQWLSRVAGARIVPSMNFVDKLPINEVIGCGASKFSVTDPDPNGDAGRGRTAGAAPTAPNVPLMTLRGSAERLGVTVLLRGADADLRRAKMVLRAALLPARAMRLLVSFCFDSNLSAPPLATLVESAIESLLLPNLSLPPPPNYFTGGITGTIFSVLQDTTLAQGATDLSPPPLSQPEAAAIVHAWVVLDAVSLERGCVPARLLLAAPLLPAQLRVGLARLLRALPATPRVNFCASIPSLGALLKSDRAMSDAAAARVLAAAHTSAALSGALRGALAILRGESQPNLCSISSEILRLGCIPMPATYSAACELLRVSPADGAAVPRSLRGLGRADDDAAASLPVNVCLVNTETLKQCTKPRVRLLRHYGAGDKSLGAFLMERCFDEGYICRTCESSPLAHALAFSHGTHRVTVTVRRLNNVATPATTANAAALSRSQTGANADFNSASPPPTKRPVSLPKASPLSAGSPAGVSSGGGGAAPHAFCPSAPAGAEAPIVTWSYCNECRRQSSALTRLSRGASTFSFGRFLELLLIGSPTLRSGDSRLSCRHPPLSHMRYFARGRFAAAFKTTNIEPLALRVPAALPVAPPPVAGENAYIDDAAMVTQLAAARVSSSWVGIAASVHRIVASADAALAAATGLSPTQMSTVGVQRGSVSSPDSSMNALPGTATASAAASYERICALAAAFTEARNASLAEVTGAVATTATTNALVLSAAARHVIITALAFDTHIVSFLASITREINLFSKHVERACAIGRWSKTLPTTPLNGPSPAKLGSRRRSNDGSEGDDSSRSSFNTSDSVASLDSRGQDNAASSEGARSRGSSGSGEEDSEGEEMASRAREALARKLLFRADAQRALDSLREFVAKDQNSIAETMAAVAPAAFLLGRHASLTLPSSGVFIPVDGTLNMSIIAYFLCSDFHIRKVAEAVEAARASNPAQSAATPNAVAPSQASQSAAAAPLLLPIERSGPTETGLEFDGDDDVKAEIEVAATAGAVEKLAEEDDDGAEGADDEVDDHAMDEPTADREAQALSVVPSASGSAAEAFTHISGAVARILLTTAARVDVKREFSDRGAVAAAVRDGDASNSIAVFCTGTSLQVEVTAFWAVHFAALRALIVGGGDGAVDGFVASIASSQRWAASGGASGARFERSSDKRFVAKIVSRTEFDMFVNGIAKGYFSHVSGTILDGAPSVLARILGAYKIVSKIEEWERNRTDDAVQVSAPQSVDDPLSPQRGADVSDGVSARARVIQRSTTYIMIMENLFSTREIAEGLTFDLKGKLRAQKRPVAPVTAAPAPPVAPHHPNPTASPSAEMPSQSGSSGVNDPVATGESSSFGTMASSIVKSAISPGVVMSPTGSNPAATTGANAGLVLLDGDLVVFTRGLPLQLTGNAKAYLDAAMRRDTAWLASEQVVDYSLLLGVEPPNGVLSCGIIDYIRRFDIVKRLENTAKTAASLVTNVEATVLEPERYAERLRRAADRYLADTPNTFSRWAL